MKKVLMMEEMLSTRGNIGKGSRKKLLLFDFNFENNNNTNINQFPSGKSSEL